MWASLRLWKYVNLGRILCKPAIEPIILNTCNLATSSAAAIANRRFLKSSRKPVIDRCYRFCASNSSRSSANVRRICNANCHLTEIEYEKLSEETLQALTEVCDSLSEHPSNSSEYDVSYSMGVLTVKFGKIGTYVINKQTPNQQIWLSSPVSGPKRYDFKNGQWVYLHDGVGMLDLLNKEFRSHLKDDTIDFKCLLTGQEHTLH